MQRGTISSRLLRTRLQSLLDALPAAASGEAAAVHRARVASRRLRELLPVLEDASKSRRFRRAGKDVRRITRALGPVRELDVALGHLQETGPRTGASPRALMAVRRYLTNERQRHRRAMLEAITPSARARVRARLVVEPAAGVAPASAPDAERHHARQRAGRRAIRLRAEMRRAGGLYVSERLHAVRVAAKKLRYALEIDRELSGSRATARVNQLKRLQDALGRIHDLEILIERTREVQAALAGTDRRTVGELDSLIATLEAECREGHAAFLRGRTALDALCRQIIDSARAGHPTFV